METIQPETATPTASRVVAACETAWLAIQRHHPELPDVVIVLGSGVERGRLVKLGHWWGARWEASGEARGEVLLAGEALHLPVEDVFEVLLHEAAHGLNAARGVKDSSRGGRYHNARYRAAAMEVGLAVVQLPPHGWAKTILTPATAERYAAEITNLRDAVQIARRFETRPKIDGADPGGRSEGRAGEAGGSTAKSSALLCGCGRRMRMAPSVAAQGPVLCGRCGTEFTVRVAAARQPAQPSGVVHVRPVSGGPAVGLYGEHGVDEVLLSRVLGTPDLLRLLARVAAWAQRHGERLDEALVAVDAIEARRLNELARAFRRAQGHLVGPDLAVGHLSLAAGDQVIVSAKDTADESGLPDVGVFGQVIAVDLGKRWLTVDFPIAGRYHIGAQQARRSLSLGYVVTTELDALPGPPATPDRAAEPSGQVAEVAEMGVL